MYLNTAKMYLNTVSRYSESNVSINTFTDTRMYLNTYLDTMYLDTAHLWQSYRRGSLGCPPGQSSPCMGGQKSTARMELGEKGAVGAREGVFRGVYVRGLGGWIGLRWGDVTPIIPNSIGHDGCDGWRQVARNW